MTTYAFFLLVLTAFFWGAPPAFEKAALRTTDPVVGLTIRSIFVSSILLIFVTFAGKWTDILKTPLRDKLFFSLSGLSAGLLGMIFYYMALKITPISKAVPVAASYPLVAVLLGIVFLGESVTLQKVAGTLLIIFGVWLVK